MLTAQTIQEHHPLLVLVGPTAIGKSRIAIEVAKALETDVLTADSRQVYRGMDIGTDKPTMDERQGITHRLIDVVDPDQPFNAGDYRRQAIREITRLHGEGRIPFLAGGTGLYVRAVVRGLWPGPSADWTLRKQMDQQASELGPDALYRELTRVDPIQATRIHPHDYPKIQRALEVYRLLGVPLSEAHHQDASRESHYQSLVIGLTMERDTLYRRIEDRVEWELEKGLVQETAQLLDQGYHRKLGSMKSLGYRQLAGFLFGEYSYSEAVRQLKRDTRHFAKRQMTWFRKEPSLHWLHIEETDTAPQIAERIMSQLQEFLAILPNHHLSKRHVRGTVTVGDS